MQNLVSKLKELKNTTGQDVIEHALMAGFVAAVLGAFVPNLASTVCTIFSELGASPIVSSTQGS